MQKRVSLTIISLLLALTLLLCSCDFTILGGLEESESSYTESESPNAESTDGGGIEESESGYTESESPNAESTDGGDSEESGSSSSTNSEPTDSSESEKSESSSSANSESTGSESEESGSSSSASSESASSGSTEQSESSSTEPKPEGCNGHTDDDANDYCDDCNAYLVIVVDFYTINDLHGKFDDTSNQPGVDELTTFLKSAKLTDDHAIFLSSGDMWQGSSESNLTQGRIITDWMNELGFASMTLGNHEFDWGEEYIEANEDIANFPLLAINVYDRATNKRVDYASPSVMIECGNVKIGIIGAIGNCYSSIASDKVQGVYFKVGSELTALVKAESEALRAAGADFIVYSIHDGIESSSSSVSQVSGSKLSSYYDAVLSDGYVDLVFEAHTHQSYVVYDQYGVYHLQGGGDNKGITHAEFAINYVTDSFKMNVVEYVKTSRYTSLPDDEIVDRLLEKYADEISKANLVVGYNKSYMSSDKLCDLVSQLYYEAGLEKWGDKYDIVLGGGFLQARSPYNLKAGNVTYGDLQSIFPFDNQLVLCSIKGRDLSSKFFNTSNDRYHIYYDQYGSSIKNNIDPNATYYIIVDSYTSTYKYNNLTEIERFEDGIYARDLLAEYFQSLK